LILRRYIYSEVREKLFWLLGLLVLILTSHRFVDYLEDAASGNIPTDLIFSMLAMKILAILPRILPVAIFMSVILTMTRLSNDRELTIISSSGLTLNFQYQTILKFSMLFAVAIFFCSFYLSPWADNEVTKLREQAVLESEVTGITAGRFKEFSNGDRVVYVKNIKDSGATMEEVFLQTRDGDRLSLLASERARFKYDEDSGSRYILFENGNRYVGTPGELNYQITEYQSYAVLVEQTSDDADSTRLESIPTSELLGSDLSSHKAELQWRLSYVIAGLLLPILAVILNRLSFGNNRYVSIIIGLLIYLIYSNLLSISKTLLERADIPAFIGLWWVHAGLFAIIYWNTRLQMNPNNKRSKVK
jgi:lipopolysaccharide export system permease protein